MMKQYIAAFALIVASAQLQAQNVNKYIQQSDVERIIKTLSADDMEGRATFTPGIEKAAKFIEAEFKQAGLVPLRGNKGFRQNFSLTRIKPTKTMVSINGKVMPADSAFTVSGLPVLNWTNNSDVQIVKVSADKNFEIEYRTYLRTGKKIAGTG